MTAATSVAIVVLGDVGRSPRMQYHALSVADDTPHSVDLIGYLESTPHARVRDHESIRLHGLRAFPRLPRALFPLWAPVKFVWLMVQLFWTLWMGLGRRPGYVMVQNPPSIPTLLVVRVYCWLTGVRLIIDWHNFGYTLLALTLPRLIRGPIVWFAKHYERLMGRGAYANLCVTRAMQSWLATEWGIEARVIYDRAPAHFSTTDIPERHALFVRHRALFAAAHRAIKGAVVDPLDTSETLWTRERRGQCSLLRDRPALIVSSTSWTPDEDFGVLLAALRVVDAHAVSQHDAGDTAFPHIVVVITGRGPMRAMYEQQIAERPMRFIHVVTCFLPFEDYPRLLGSADLGVSLHYSSSALDLAMKVVDFLGCGLPVCSINFACLPELVVEGQNGLVFETSDELAEQITRLFAAFPQTPELDVLRDGCRAFQRVRWSDNWVEHVAELFDA